MTRQTRARHAARPAPSNRVRRYAITVAVSAGFLCTVVGIVVGPVAMFLVGLVCMTGAVIGALAFPEIRRPIVTRTPEIPDTAWKVPCPMCQALPGTECVFPEVAVSGLEAVAVHPDRHDVWMALTGGRR
jgi:hypothetical protein